MSVSSVETQVTRIFLFDRSLAAFAADRSTHRARDAFRLSHRSQQVAAENFSDVLLAVTTLQQFVSDIRQHRNVFRALRHVVRAVEVRSDADVIDACDFDDVLEVVHQFRKRQRRQWIRLFEFVAFFRATLDVVFVLRVDRVLLCFQPLVARTALRRDRVCVDKTTVEVDMDDAAVLRDASQQIVGNISRHVADCACGGVRRDDGRF